MDSRRTKSRKNQVILIYGRNLTTIIHLIETMTKNIGEVKSANHAMLDVRMNTDLQNIQILKCDLRTHLPPPNGGEIEAREVIQRIRTLANDNPNVVLEK